jgi:hypothetical protein
MGGIAQAFRVSGEELRQQEQYPLAGFADQIADKVDGFSEYLDRGDIGGMLSDVEDFARREPAIFVAGAFAAGLLLTRFFKSAPPRQRRDYASGWRSNEYPIQEYDRSWEGQSRQRTPYGAGYSSAGTPGSMARPTQTISQQWSDTTSRVADSATESWNPAGPKTSSGGTGEKTWNRSSTDEGA